MNRPEDGAATIREEREAWAHHTLERERSQTRLFILLTLVLMPAWIPVDRLLEPHAAGAFLALRLVDVAVGIAALLSLRRARTLREVRMLALVKLVSTGSAIAVMLPLVAANYWTYVLGFSLLFWGTAVVLSMPAQVLASAWVIVAAVAAAALAIWPERRTFEELVGSWFFIVSMIIICVAQVVLRGRLERRAFVSAHRLAEASRKVLESEELKSQFFANVSHELRTPLALILGPAEKLLAAAELTEEQRGAAEVIVRNAQTMLGHVGNLLDVARIETGELSFEPAPTDLGRLVREIAGHFDGLAQERSLTYLVEVPEGSFDAEVDAEKVQRVLLNLLSNAFKVTPAGGRIRCTLTRLQERAAIEVADSGPGVRPEHRSMIFERFRQVEGGSARQLGGTGLGLPIAMELVELHGGIIAVDDAPESGASFRVELPVRSPAGARVEAGAERECAQVELAQQALAELGSGAPALPDDQGGLAPLVLVVEDNPDMNRFVREILAPTYRTAAALDGPTGLEKARELLPDLVVCDIMMPGMSGDQLIAGIRARRELDDLPILVLSARADDALRIRLLREGAQDYVTKPFAAEELRARVANLVDLRRARAVLRAELDSKEESTERLARELAAHRRTLESALESTRTARELAERASELKTSFLHLVSHELRTPLAALLLQAERFDYPVGAPLPPDKQQLARRMKRSAYRLRDIVESLLEYARIQSGKLATEIESFDLPALAEEALEDVRPLAQAKGLALELERAVGLAPLSSDPRVVRLILVNLLGNAVKFTETGRVTLSLGRNDGALRARVRDTGPGIPAEQRDRIFEPFAQVAPIRHKHIIGVGLGLALVRELASAIGARVDLESTSEHGSTFAVRLPDVAAEPPQTAQPAGCS